VELFKTGTPRADLGHSARRILIAFPRWEIRRCRSFALATCLASMKNTYTKTEIRISCPFPQVNGPEDKKDKI
jgi:hypothetical protein